MLCVVLECVKCWGFIGGIGGCSDGVLLVDFVVLEGLLVMLDGLFVVLDGMVVALEGFLVELEDIWWQMVCW